MAGGETKPSVSTPKVIGCRNDRGEGEGGEEPSRRCRSDHQGGKTGEVDRQRREGGKREKTSSDMAEVCSQ